jgi:hypothetical protein
VTEILSRAFVDDEYRKLLFADQATATKEFELSDEDRELLASIPKESFEKQAQNLREHNVVGAEVRVMVGAQGHFNVARPSTPE